MTISTSEATMTAYARRLQKPGACPASRCGQDFWETQSVRPATRSINGSAATFRSVG